MKAKPLRWRLVAILGFAIGAISLAWQIQLEYHYTRTAPHFPEPSIGRIYPLTVHSQTVYLTKAESDMANGPWMLIMLVGLGLFLLAVNVMEGPRSSLRH